MKKELNRTEALMTVLASLETNRHEGNREIRDALRKALGLEIAAPVVTPAIVQKRFSEFPLDRVKRAAATGEEVARAHCETPRDLEALFARPGEMWVCSFSEPCRCYETT